ncbi:hypothetical protein V6N12_034557 [Hibiscus sabdariffa]|uniref:Uncharacterized protein n=1 Tax=Hibiscus sabdariffa TaxID=183260 RepID=A0ABR2DHG9_9ROSI
MFLPEYQEKLHQSMSISTRMRGASTLVNNMPLRDDIPLHGFGLTPKQAKEMPPLISARPYKSVEKTLLIKRSLYRSERCIDPMIDYYYKGPRFFHSF